MNWNWLPWRRHKITNGHDVKAAKADAEQKLREAKSLGGRVERAAAAVRDINEQNHIRQKMERALRGQG